MTVNSGKLVPLQLDTATTSLRIAVALLRSTILGGNWGDTPQAPRRGAAPPHPAFGFIQLERH